MNNSEFSNLSPIEFDRPTLVPEDPAEPVAVEVEFDEDEKTELDIPGVEYAEDGTVIDPNSLARVTEEKKLIGADKFSREEAERIKQGILSDSFEPSVDLPTEKILVEAEWEPDTAAEPVDVKTDDGWEELAA